MTRLKRYLRSTAKSALISSQLFIAALALSSCSINLEPTYKEREIPSIIKKICRENYGLRVNTERVGNTLWVYAPVEKMLHDEYGLKGNGYFDEGAKKKIRDIDFTITRLILSSDNIPEFVVFVVSDINLGIDYTTISATLDTKKYYSDFLTVSEIDKRRVVRLKSAPEAIQDETGFHILKTGIKLPDFLAEQIAQRINSHFYSEGMEKFLKVENVEGKFKDGIFYFEYSIVKTALPKERVSIRSSILKIIAYCIDAYEFKNFKGAALKDVRTDDQFEFVSPATLKEYHI